MATGSDAGKHCAAGAATSWQPPIMNTPLVSVIIPCYRQAGFLPQAVGSVLAQTCPDWECLIINDGSPDNTRTVAEPFLTDTRIRYLEHSNRGVSFTRNRGIDESRGRYIQFLDADDLITPMKLESQTTALRGVPELAVAYCDYRYCTPDGVVMEDHPWYRSPRMQDGHELEDLASRWEIDLSTAIHGYLFDARIFRDHGIRFDEMLPANEDWDCWMQVFALRPKAVYIDKPCALYRLHELSRTRNGAMLRAGLLAALKKQERIHRSDPHMRTLLHEKTRLVKRAYRPWSPWRCALRRFTSVPRGFLRRFLPPRYVNGLRRLRDGRFWT